MREVTLYGTISPMPTTNVELKKNLHENGVSLVRRFSRKMQEAGIIPKVKSIRYAVRPMSKLGQKNMRIKSLVRRKEVERLKKLGKM
mgnify:CR=1 FL=1